MTEATRARDLLDGLGLLAGAVLGSIPGGWALVGWMVTASTGTGAGSDAVPFALLCGGLLAGAIGGLALADRLVTRTWPPARALGAATVGLVAGAALGLAIVAAATGTAAELAALATAALLPFAAALRLFRRRRDGHEGAV